MQLVFSVFPGVAGIRYIKPISTMKNIILILCFVPALLFAQKRVDQLPEITTPADSDILVGSRGGSFWQVGFDTFKDYVGTVQTAFLLVLLRRGIMPLSASHRGKRSGGDDG